MAEDHEFSSVEEILIEAAEHKHCILYLNYKGLSELPTDLFQEPICNSVERLFLKRNQLTSVVKISHICNLESLDVSCNNLTSISPTIGNLKKLKKLHLSNNDLKSLPAEIGKLKKLTNLEAINNKLVLIPNEICECGSLVTLALDCNRLKELPRDIIKLQYLTEISLAGNKLTHLPSDMGYPGLPSLKSIYVDNNTELHALPFSLWMKEIGANCCGSSDIHQSSSDGLLTEVDGYCALLPPEIKKCYTLQDSYKFNMPTLLDCCLKAVYHYSNQGLRQIDKWDLPQNLCALVRTPTAHCIAPNGCETPIFTIAYVRLLKLVWAQQWQNNPDAIVFIGMCCSRKCLEIFTRVPVPV
uniref:Leucine-rich repeat-containing protein 28-like n=1 Tax=Saccoglossus kowalevskii TaxID=10224 RepID=A0ABM0MGD8_SACKO|nr:PREDICTED: leucine-rich repeat-containing protein 28-like [Saccoglossus kowalevskii]